MPAKYFAPLLVVLTILHSCVSTLPPTPATKLTFALENLEQSSGGRIGFAAINISAGKIFEYRAHERFPLCSTFKVMVAAAILGKSVSNPSLLQKQVLIRSADTEPVGHAPITKVHIGKTMSIAELCAAAVEYSDNAAANLLMKELGGPAAVTVYARTLGDQEFALERWEPELNTAIPGDLRDTSTPLASVKSLQQLILNGALPPAQTEQLVKWLKGNTTGDRRIRAGVPSNWVVGDKTGTGSYGTTNDIAVLWATPTSPFVMAVYFTQPTKDATARDEIVAAVARLATTVLPP